LFDFVRKINKLKLSKKDAKGVKKIMIKFDLVLGLGLDKIKKVGISNDIKKLISDREKAR